MLCEANRQADLRRGVGDIDDEPRIRNVTGVKTCKMIIRNFRKDPAASYIIFLLDEGRLLRRLPGETPTEVDVLIGRAQSFPELKCALLKRLLAGVIFEFIERVYLNGRIMFNDAEHSDEDELEGMELDAVDEYILYG